MRKYFGLIVVLAIVSIPVGLPAADSEAEALKIEELLMAPCCGGTTLDVHNSAAAGRMKLEIREMLSSGMSRQEILDGYVAEYGDAILSMPSAHGFGLVAYLVPLIALILGPLLTWVIVRRWTRGAAQGAATDPLPAAPLDSKYVDRIEKELRSY